MLSSFSIDVIDPCNRTGKINVPMKYVFETRGVVDHQRNPNKRDVKDLSLCLLFQKGRCNAGARCHQVHCDVDYVVKLRNDASSARNCCAAHGDVHSTGYLEMAKDVSVTDAQGNRKTYSAAAFGRTQAMDNFMRRSTTGTTTVPAAKICRLHTQGRCKFGKDCKNVHLCPNATEKPAFATPAKISVPALGGGSAAKESCGLSNGSRSASSNASMVESPLEKTINPLNFSDLHEGSSLAESGFSLFSQPMKSVKAQSPQFDASGFEKELSLVQKDLWSMEASSPTGWKPW